jgi:predicted transcriptional regulator
MAPQTVPPSATASPESEQAVAYQRLMDLAAEADEQEGVRQGDEDIAAGLTRPADEVFAEMRKQFGLQRNARGLVSTLPI